MKLYNCVCLCLSQVHQKMHFKKVVYMTSLDGPIFLGGLENSYCYSFDLNGTVMVNEHTWDTAT